MRSEVEKRIACLNNLNWFSPQHCHGRFQIPTIARNQNEKLPQRLIDFSHALRSKEYTAGIHFFLDDYRFERIWSNVNRYIPILSRFCCVLTPDFSLFQNMPIAQQIWNVYRSRLMGYAMRQVGIQVIPTVSWADSNSYGFCFDGIESGGTVAISSVGTNRRYESRKNFQDGMKEMIQRIHPGKIVFYGPLVSIGHPNIQLFHYKNTSVAWKTEKNK